MGQNTENNSEKSRIRYLGNNNPAETVIALQIFVHDALGAGEREVRLRKDQVTRYYAGDDDLSVLETTEKEKIYVALPFTELCSRMEARIAPGRGNIIDLTKFTGAPVRELLLHKKIAGIFNAAAINDTVGNDDVLILMNGYAKASGGNAQEIAFLASDIEKYDDNFLRLSGWKNYNKDWDMGDLSCGPYIRIPPSHLKEDIRKAINNGVKVLNLTETTDTPIEPHRVKFSISTHHLRPR